MNIFGGRPGIAAGILAVIAILAAAFLSLQINIILIALTLVLVAVCGVLLARGIVKPYRFFSITVVCAVVISTWLGGLSLFYRDAPETEALCGEESYVHATVAERYASGEYYTKYLIRIKSVNGIPYDGKAILDCEYNSDLQVGYEFVLRAADVEYAFNLAENEAVSYISEKIFLRIISFGDSDCHIISEGKYTFADRLASVNSYLSARLKNTVGGDAGRLASAMLLGDKSSITSEMYRDFSRSGISHYLAVSGLHVSIITGIVAFILINLRVKRSLRNILLILFAVGYLLILGFPVSAVRSVTMLTIVFLAYSLGDNSDTLNSLGIAASLILVTSPSAVFDKSFILSFCATLGIAAFLPVLASLPHKFKKDGKEEKRQSKLRKLLFTILSAVMTTLSAVSATLLPSALMFGETSAYSLITNLILAPVGAPMLASAILCLIFGKIPLLVRAVEIFSSIILEVSARFCDIEGAAISLVSRGALMVVLIFTAVLVLVLLIKIKRKEALLAIPAAYPLVLALISIVSVAALPKTAEITCVGTGSDEMILLQLRDENTVIDISDGSYTRLRMIADVAQQEGMTEFDTVMLTHYHSRHISALSRFTAEEKVRLVLLPYPTTEDEAWIMVQIADVLQRADVAVRVIEPEGDLELVSGITLTYPSITRIARSAQPVTYLSFTDGKERVTYLSSSSWDVNLYFTDELEALAIESKAILIGAHGPVNKTPFDIPIDTSTEVYAFGEDPSFLVARKDHGAIVNCSVTKYIFGSK